MASQKAKGCEPQASHDAVAVDRLYRILRTTGSEATRGGKCRPDPLLIRSDHPYCGRPSTPIPCWLQRHRIQPYSQRLNPARPRTKRPSRISRMRFRGSRLTSPRASRSTCAPVHAGLRAYASRATRRTRARVTAVPALCPSATINLPACVGLCETKSVSWPVATRTPVRRICAVGELAFLRNPLTPERHTVSRCRPLARLRLITF
jgi:hypothetical protein